MGDLVFGTETQAYCIDNVSLTTKDGTHLKSKDGKDLCLAYRVEYTGLVFPAYMRDAGYALKERWGKGRVYTLDDATTKELQQSGTLSDPLPSYSLSTTNYAWGFSFWPFLLLLIVATVLRRRSATRRHLADSPKLDAGASGIEVNAGHSWLMFSLPLAAPTITIDGVAHKRSWGTWTFPVTPGHHKVEAFYTWFNERARASLELDVEPGQVARIKYYVIFSLITPIMKVEDSTPTARVEQIPGG
jgi:hypothetical protein